LGKGRSQEKDAWHNGIYFGIPLPECQTVRENFRRGLDLCRQLLQRGSIEDAERIRRLRAIEQSFRNGLGEDSEELIDYDDEFKGGD